MQEGQRRILVTGASGVLGRVLTPRLRAAGHAILAPGKAELDLFDREAVRRAVAETDAVMHLATRIPESGTTARPGAWEETNRLRAEATSLLVDAALEAGTAVFVLPTVALLSTRADLSGEPWAQAALDGERQVERFAAEGGRGVILRLGLLHGTPQAAGRPAAGLPRLHVSDAGAALAAALDAQAGVYDVVAGDGPPSSVRFRRATGWRSHDGRDGAAVTDHARWLVEERDHLLAFARAARVPDGFGWLDADGRPDPAQPAQLWITARMTHVFALGDLLGLPGCSGHADHGLEGIAAFEDSRHGGWFSQRAAGAPGSGDKQAYSHAFVLLAAASARLAGRPGAAELLERASGVVSDFFWSQDDGACLEKWDRGWGHSEPYRGANANMHMVEAFLAVADATGDSAWTDRALRIAGRIVDHTARAHAWRVVEHYDAAWRPLPGFNRDRPRDRFRPGGVTPGHAFEWSRLLLSLRSALERPPEWLLEAARALFDRALRDALQPGGGLVYTTDLTGRPLVADRLHWVTAEAIGAAATLHSVTGDARYDAVRASLWRYVRLHLLDLDRGSWHHELDDRDRPSQRLWQGKPDVYHALQATLVERLPVAPSLAGAVLAARRE